MRGLLLAKLGFALLIRGGATRANWTSWTPVRASAPAWKFEP